MCLCTGHGGRDVGGSGSRRSRRRNRRRWPEVAVLGRAMFVVSVAFFVVGILITVFGFGGGGAEAGGGGAGGGGAGGEGTIGIDGTGSAIATPDTEVRPTRHALPMQVSRVSVMKSPSHY
jgi:hypothetical protein